jgi:hypothetical protein
MAHSVQNCDIEFESWMECGRTRKILDNKISGAESSASSNRELIGNNPAYKKAMYINFTLLSQRGATEHSSTRPRFSTHNLLIVFKCMYTDCKYIGKLKKMYIKTQLLNIYNFPSDRGEDELVQSV